MKIPLIIIAVILFCCGERVQTLHSTSQEWVGGIRESGYGTDYKITVKVKAGSEQLSFGELWVDSVRMKIRLSDPSHLQLKSFTKGSVLTLAAGKSYRPGPDERAMLAGADRHPAPENYKGRGLLSYTYKGKIAYIEIAEFEKLEKIIYP
jgi:hypothetical protein